MALLCRLCRKSSYAARMWTPKLRTQRKHYVNRAVASENYHVSSPQLLDSVRTNVTAPLLLIQSSKSEVPDGKAGGRDGRGCHGCSERYWSRHRLCFCSTRGSPRHLRTAGERRHPGRPRLP